MNQEKNTAQFSAIVDSILKKKDNTLSIKLGTQEINNVEHLSKLFSFGNKQIWVAFAETELAKEDILIPDFVEEYKGQKSHSQRLHGVLYRLWETTDKSKTSKQFYEDYMEKLIDHIKSKL